VLVALGAVERSTGGWGREARIFGLGTVRQDDPVTQWLAYSGPIIAAAAICALAGIGALATTQRWWPSIGNFLGGRPSLTLFTAYPLLFALALGGAAWLVLRRATV
jgi:hypothetical protein